MPRARVCLGRVPARGWSPRPSSSSPRTVEAEPLPFPRGPAAGELPGRAQQPGSAPSPSQPLPPPPLPSCPPLLPPPASPSPGFSPRERAWGDSRTPRALAMPGAGKVGFLPRLSSSRWRGICPGPGLLGHRARPRSGSAVLTPSPAAPARWSWALHGILQPGAGIPKVRCTFPALQIPACPCARAGHAPALPTRSPGAGGPWVSAGAVWAGI